MQRICVFCGSSLGRKPIYADAARELAEAMTGRGIGLVYGGARVGIMGLLADAVLAGGGEVHGVLPDVLRQSELMHEGLTELHLVATMHERKALMNELCDGFIALPGGFGTLEELFEAITWSQLKLHDKPIGLLNVDGYYDPLLGFLRQAVEQEYIRAPQLDRLYVERDVARLIDTFRQ